MADIFAITTRGLEPVSAQEVAAIPAVVKYLTDMTGAAASAQGDIAKAKAAADKTAADAQKNSPAIRLRQ